MVVEVPKSVAEKASPVAHKEKAKKQLEARMKDTGNEILLETVKKNFQQAVAAKEPVQQMQLKSYQWYMTGEYSEEVIDGGEHHVNFVKTLLRNIRSRIADAKPTPIAIPRKPDDWHVANLHDSTMEYILDENDWRHDIFENVVFDAVVKGDSFTSEEWNEKMGENGNVQINWIDALRFFPGSSARKLQNQGTIYILHSDPLHKVVEKFPEAEMEAAASAGGPFPNLGDAEHFFDRIPMSAFSQHRMTERFEDESRRVMIAGSGDQEEGFRQFEDNVNYVECFTKYPKGHPLAETFPNGRRTYFTNDAILADQKWEMERLPYTQFSVETEGDMFWHQSVVQQLASPQKVVNKLSNLVIDAAEQQTNTPLISPVNGGLDPDEYENVSDTQNRVLYMHPQGAQMTGHIDPPPFPDSALETMQLYINQTEQLSGVQDISQGRIPGSLQSGQAIDLLQEAAQTIIRHYSRPIQQGVKELGLTLSENIQKHFTEERVIRTGDKQHNSFITLNKRVKVQVARDNLFEAQQLAQAAQDAQQRARAQRQAQEAQKAIRREIEAQKRKEATETRLASVVLNDPTLFQVDIRIASGGDKLSRVGRLKEAMQLYEAGAIDRKELLRVADWENKDEVLDRVSEAKQLKQQNEALKDRVERIQKALREVNSQLDSEAQRMLQSAVQGNM